MSSATAPIRYRIFRGSQIFHDLPGFRSPEPGFRSPCAPRHPCAPRRAPASPQGLDRQAGPGAERDTEATGAWTIIKRSVMEPLPGLGEVVAVEAERDVVRHAGASDLAEVGGVEGEQERGADGAVEHD